MLLKLSTLHIKEQCCDDELLCKREEEKVQNGQGNILIHTGDNRSYRLYAMRKMDSGK